MEMEIRNGVKNSVRAAKAVEDVLLGIKYKTSQLPVFEKVLTGGTGFEIKRRLYAKETVFRYSGLPLCKIEFDKEVIDFDTMEIKKRKRR